MCVTPLYGEVFANFYAWNTGRLPYWICSVKMRIDGGSGLYVPADAEPRSWYRSFGDIFDRDMVYSSINLQSTSAIHHEDS